MAMRMKKSAVSIAAVAAVAGMLSVSGCALTTPSIAEAPSHTVEQGVSDGVLAQAGTLTVALDETNAPQAMSENNELSGYAVDVAAALADSLGLKVSFVNAASANDAATADADIFIGASSKDASSSVTIVDEYLESATAIFGASDGASITADMLSASTVGVQDSSASQDALNRTGVTATQKTYSSINACFEALAAGEVDYVACDAASGAYLARVYANVGYLGCISTVSSQNVAIASGKTELQQAVASALSEMTNDGTLEAIHTYWFGGMPADLSDTVVSGVTLSSETTNTTSSDDAESDDSSSDSSTDGDSEEDATITDSDINKLNTSE